MLPSFSTRKELALIVCGLLTGFTCIAVGSHFSYANIGRQQARTQARKEYVKARLRKLFQD